MRRKRPIIDPRMLVTIPLLIALFVSAFAFGGTTSKSLLATDILLALGLLGWAGVLVAERRLPKIPRLACAAIVVLAVLAIAHWLNPKYFFDEASWSLLPVSSAISGIPGSVDMATSLPAIRHGLLLLGTLALLMEVISDRRARWSLLSGLGTVGFLIALVGLSQKAGGADSMLWVGPEESGASFFAAFRYHANAAAFLNLCWPAAFAMWLRSCHRVESGFFRSYWLVAFAFTFLGVLANSSKAGHLVGLALAALAVVRFRKIIFWEGRNWKAASLGVGGVAFVLLLAILPGLFANWLNWSDALDHGESAKGRLEAYTGCLTMLGESGIWGFGPGTFHLVFPFYTGGLDEDFSGFWDHAHQDFLQTLIEWGWAGFAAFLILVLGGFVRGFRATRSAMRSERLEFSQSCSLIALGGVFLHAFVDFPLQIPAIQIPVLILLAIAWSGKKSQAVHHLREGTKKAREVASLEPEKLELVESEQLDLEGV
ncbi:MAG: O-antigen ligase family protein [Verrucomicrobiota bacterium]